MIAAVCGDTMIWKPSSSTPLTAVAVQNLVNEVMAEYFSEPYPARAAIGVASLPKGAAVEMDAGMELDD